MRHTIKTLRRLLALLLAAALVFALAACGEDEDDEDEEDRESQSHRRDENDEEPEDGGDREFSREDPKEDRDDPEETEDQEDGDQGSLPDIGTLIMGPRAEDYYRFLREEIDGGRELASADQVILSVTMSDYESTVGQDAVTGLISAQVLDFDRDGELEMLTLSARNLRLADSVLGADEYSREYRTLTLTAELYDYRDGQIVWADSLDTVLLPTSGWGYMLAGLEEIDGEYYLYTHIYSENMSTYGPDYDQVSLVKDGITDVYVSGSTFFHTVEEARALLGISEPLDIDKYTLYDTLGTVRKTQQVQDSIDPEAGDYKAALGDGLLCFYEVSCEEWGSTVLNLATDYTQLRHYLETGASDWIVPPVAQGGEREQPDPSLGVELFIGELTETSHVTLTNTASDEAEGVLSSYYTSSECSMTVKLDRAANQITFVGLWADDEPTPQEWFDLKDAILQNSAFGLDPTAVAPLLGEVNWNDYAGGADLGAYECVIGKVFSAAFQLRVKN